jgi:hypothetical protein
MKYILFLIIASLLTATTAFSQCTVGGDGIAVSTAITVDGTVTDWNAVLADPDNYANDATPDQDAPIADVGRNFTRFAFTETYSKLFFLFSRAGSATNAVDALLYLDVNNNGLMETNEPVIAISWSGSNGNGKVDIYNYVQAGAGGDVVSGDGVDMPGSLLLRTNLGTIGRGTTDGYSLEVGIPFTQLYKQGSSNPADILAPNDPFKFHVSTINGSPTSVPGPNAINDNFNGCYAGLMVLPVKLEYFESNVKNNAVELSWKVANNEEAAKFEIEKSADGKEYNSIATIYPANKGTQSVYRYTDDKTNQANIYYRLKITDSDGVITFSKVIVINFNKALFNLKIANPVYADMTMMYESSNNQQCSIRMFNTAGVLVHTQQVTVHTGSNRIQVSGNYMRSGGGYIIEFTDELNNRITNKIVKM